MYCVYFKIETQNYLLEMIWFRRHDYLSKTLEKKKFVVGVLKLILGTKNVVSETKRNDITRMTYEYHLKYFF